jgi:putative oxidoreductase
MRSSYEKFASSVEKLKDLPLLFLRLILAYGFFEPAMNKFKDFGAVAEWFGSMNYPLPLVSAYLAGITEMAGVILLFLGLGTRFITIPLMIVMLVAIFTVHISNGFAAGDSGFEIPLYYFLMLFTLMVFGSGRISLDRVFRRK